MVAIVDSLYSEGLSDLTALADTYDLSGTHLWHHSATTSVLPDGTTTVFSIPANATTTSGTTILRLQLVNATSTLSANTYWIPNTNDNFTMGGCFTGCAVTTFANMTDLSTELTRLNLDVAWAQSQRVDDTRVGLTIAVRNPSEVPAFFIRLRLLRSDGTDVLPALWDDNYLVWLLPNETETVHVSWSTDDQPDMDVSVVAVPYNNVVGTPPH